MYRRTPLLIVLCAVSLACGRPQETETTATAPRAADQDVKMEPYTLEVIFDGLMAFVEDEGKVWALLVNAPAYDPTAPDTMDLPPCVSDESISPSELARKYPPHKAHIRFKNAVVGGIADPRKGTSLRGEDVRILTGRTGIGTMNLSILASKQQVARSRNLPPADVAHLDQINPVYLTPDPGTVTNEFHLAARVLIAGGDSLIAEAFSCGVGDPLQYSFVKPGEDPKTDCIGQHGQLGEQVVLVQAGLTAPAEIKLLTSGKTFTIEPQTPGGTATVEIVNITQKYVDDPDDDGCDATYRHLMAYRWFYRLGMNTNHPNSNCADHFFPCEAGGDFGGRKCPQKLFVR